MNGILDKENNGIVLVLKSNEVEALLTNETKSAAVFDPTGKPLGDKISITCNDSMGPTQAKLETGDKQIDINIPREALLLPSFIKGIASSIIIQPTAEIPEVMLINGDSRSLSIRNNLNAFAFEKKWDVDALIEQLEQEET